MYGTRGTVWCDTIRVFANFSGITVDSSHLFALEMYLVDKPSLLFTQKGPISSLSFSSEWREHSFPFS